MMENDLWVATSSTTAEFPTNFQIMFFLFLPFASFFSFSFIFCCCWTHTQNGFNAYDKVCSHKMVFFLSFSFSFSFHFISRDYFLNICIYCMFSSVLRLSVICIDVDSNHGFNISTPQLSYEMFSLYASVTHLYSRAHIHTFSPSFHHPWINTFIDGKWRWMHLHMFLVYPVCLLLAVCTE